jgi:hypothetical protein
MDWRWARIRTAGRGWVSGRLNRISYQKEHGPEIESRVEQHEMACRMQTRVPEVNLIEVDSKSVHDLHATILDLMVINHTRLTHFHQGRLFRLTDVYGKIVKPTLA